MTVVCFTLNGFGASMWQTYPADMAATLTDPWNDVAAQFFGDAFGNKIYWQPCGYNDSIPIPMQPGIDSGTREYVRLLTDVHPTGPFVGIYYSEGAIIGSNVLDLLRGVDNTITQRYKDLPDITHRYKDFLGAATFGNPRREQGSIPRLPGAIDPGGHGIVTPNLVDTPSTWWDFAAGKSMPGSPGQDLYTTCGYDGDAQTAIDEESVWKIVDSLQLIGSGSLPDELWRIVTHPGTGIPSAYHAIIDALKFFVLELLAPHNEYQVIQPVAGDPRDCWAIACDHIASLVGQTLIAPPP